MYNSTQSNFEFEPWVWYTIPHYNGYEFKMMKVESADQVPEDASGYDPNTGIAHAIRTFKHFNQFPHGKILPYEHSTKKGPNYYYEMTKSDNTRKRLKYNEVINLIKKEPFWAKKVGENDRNVSSRNITLEKQTKTPYVTTNVAPSKIQEYTFGALMKDKILNNNGD